MPIGYPQEGQAGGPQQYYQVTPPVGASPDLTQVVDELNFHLTNISHRFGQTTPDGNIEYNIIGGWNVSQDEIYVTNVILNSTDEKITIGSIVIDGKADRFSILSTAVVIDGGDKYIAINSVTYGTAGIQLQYNAGTPQAYIGDGSNKYFKYTSAGGVECKNFTVNDIQQGSEISIQGWQHDLVFSATDADTVAWASGTITLMDGTTYSIDAGNTGNISAITYIYLDIAVSSGTVLQKTTTAATAVGSGKILVAVAEDKTDEAFFQVFGGIGGVLLSADMIATNAITANEIAANAVTAVKINVTNLAAINADMGTITAGSIDAARITTGSLAVARTDADVTANNSQNLGWITGTAGTLTIASSGKLVINVADALEIAAAGNVLVKQGGDIIMEGGSSGNPSLIRFKDEVVPGEMRYERSDDSTKYIHLRKATTDNWIKLGNPTTLPTGDGYGLAFNHDGSKLAIAHGTTPFVTIYNTSDWSKIADPGTKPASTGQGVAFNHDSSLLAVGHDNTPFVTIYDTSDWSKVANPGTLPTGICVSVAFNHDGSLLAVTDNNDPFVIIYNTSDWSKVNDPGTKPTGAGTGVAFNNDSSLLAVAHDNSPFVTIYNTSDWSKVTNPGTLPTGRGEDVAFNHDGSLLTVAHDVSPYITIYNTSNWSKVTNPSTLPASNGQSVAFDYDGTLMAVGYVASNYASIYNTSDWSRVVDSVQPAPSIGEGVAFNHNGTLFAVAHRNAPYVSIYNTDVFYIQPSTALDNVSGLYLGSPNHTFTEILLNAPAIVIPNLPTSNPGAGVLWNDSNTVKVGT